MLHLNEDHFVVQRSLRARLYMHIFFLRKEKDSYNIFTKFIRDGIQTTYCTWGVDSNYNRWHGFCYTFRRHFVRILCLHTIFHYSFLLKLIIKCTWQIKGELSDYN